MTIGNFREIYISADDLLTVKWIIVRWQWCIWEMLIDYFYIFLGLEVVLCWQMQKK